MATVDDLYEIAVKFLDASTEALNLTDAGAPDRRYVSDGQAALDCCDQLAVWNQTLDQHDTFGGRGGLANQRRARKLGTLPRVLVVIQATRCCLYPPFDPRDGELPKPADIQRTAQMIDQDGWALLNWLDHELREGDLAQVCAGCEFLNAQKLTPQGECVGWTFQYRYPLDPGMLGT